VAAQHLPDRRCRSTEQAGHDHGTGIRYARACRISASASAVSRRGCRFGTGG